MKKHIALVLALFLGLSLAGCGAYRDNGQDTLTDVTDSTEENRIPDEPSESFVTVTANGVRIEPYLHAVAGTECTDNGFLAWDSDSIEPELPELIADGLVPQLQYAKDIQIAVGTNINGPRFVLLYDDQWNLLQELGALQEISGLEADPGEYYVDFSISEEGNYIEEANESEYTVYQCVFRLVIAE